MRKLPFKQVSRNKIKVSSCNCCLFDILLQGIGLHANLRGRIIDLNPSFFELSKHGTCCTNNIFESSTSRVPGHYLLLRLIVIFF